MLISNEKASVLFAPFKAAFGDDELFTKFCNDSQAAYGRADADIKAQGGDWETKGKVSKGEIINKAKYLLMLPLNSPITTLTMAALDLRAFRKAHNIEENELVIGFPKSVTTWLLNTKKEAKDAAEKAKLKAAKKDDSKVEQPA